MVQSVAEAQELVAFTSELCVRLKAQAERLSEQPASSEPTSATDATPCSSRAEEQAWLLAAAARLEREIARVQESFVRAALLPEFESERKARLQGLEQALVDSLEGLREGLTRRVGAGNPLVEVLFPHQKFEKLRRNRERLQAYMKDFERRRSSTYVSRMCADPEYPFLTGLLSQVAQAKSAMLAAAAEVPPPNAEQDAIRSELLATASRLLAVLRQARALAEAALAFEPEQLAALGVDYKLRRRAPRDSVKPEPNSG